MTEKRVPAGRGGGQAKVLRAAQSDALCAKDSTNAQTRQVIHVGGRMIGHVENETFYKHVRASKHMYRARPAWAFDFQSLADAERAGAVYVEVHDTETDTIYRASIATIRRRGFMLHHREHGEQLALDLKHFSVTQRGEEQAVQLAFA